jgi:catechol 2,3-dioxygenase-like lactoylglutathione lyase family enzyme
MPMNGRSLGQSWGVVLDAPDPRALARFYAELLGWRIATDEPDWVTLESPEGAGYLAFQSAPEYVPPAWPATEGHQQMMLHLDIEVHDLEAAVADAVSAGSVLASYQPQETVRVLLDPAGHPFCLYLAD